MFLPFRNVLCVLSGLSKEPVQEGVWSRAYSDSVIRGQPLGHAGKLELAVTCLECVLITEAVEFTVELLANILSPGTAQGWSLHGALSSPHCC